MTLNDILQLYINDLARTITHNTTTNWFRSSVGICDNLKWWLQSNSWSYLHDDVERVLLDLFISEGMNPHFPFNTTYIDFICEQARYSNTKRVNWIIEHTNNWQPIENIPNDRYVDVLVTSKSNSLYRQRVTNVCKSSTHSKTWVNLEEWQIPIAWINIPKLPNMENNNESNTSSIFI